MMGVQYRNENTPLRKVLTLMVPKNSERSYSLSEMHKSILENPKTAERFWAHVKKAEGCWLWKSTINKDGYGQFCLKFPDGKWRVVTAHRVAYVLGGGVLKENMTLDHIRPPCTDRACVVFTHLEQVTNQENVLRGRSVTAINAKKTHCVHGHEFTLANIRLVPLGRDCRECSRLNSRAFRMSR